MFIIYVCSFFQSDECGLSYLIVITFLIIPVKTNVLYIIREGKCHHYL